MQIYQLGWKFHSFQSLPCPLIGSERLYAFPSRDGAADLYSLPSNIGVTAAIEKNVFFFSFLKSG